MKTKKFFAKYILAIFTALCIVSNYACGDSDDEPQSSTSTEDTSSSPDSSTSSDQNSESTVSVIFSSVDEVDIVAGETVSIEYTLKNATSGTTVTVSPTSNYKASVENQTTSGGTIIVTAPDIYSDGSVAVTVTDEYGNGTLYVISFYEREMTISGVDLTDGLTYSVSPLGETIEIPVSVNFEYEFDIPSEDQEWIGSNVTSRSTMRDESITLTVSANTSESDRESLVSILPENGSSSYIDISIKQAAPYFYVDETEFVADSNGDTLVFNVTSNIGFSLNIPSGVDWISTSIESEGDVYTVSLFLDENPGYERNTSISLYSSNDDLLSEIYVTQNSNEKRCMIFYVSANSSNSYKVLLPIRYADCIVDWGDGTIEEFYQTSSVSHTYSGYSSETYFDVKVYGTVTSLTSYSYWSNDAYSNCTIYAIKQWGKTGLKNMKYAFYRVHSLSSIPADDLGAFEEVEDFSCCFFYNNISTIPNELFKYCSNVTSFYSVFENCPIESIPDDLFSNCVSVQNFGCAFENTDITSIPENLFSNCTEVLRFHSTFQSCSSLTSIPSDLFSNCKNVINFNYTFAYCRNVTGESPYSIINGEKVHLYERGNYPDEFSSITSFSSCFRNCTKLSDYDEIPDGWK